MAHIAKKEVESKVEALLKRLCHSLIIHREAFQIVTRYSGARNTTYALECHADDGRRIVGKGGDRFRSLKFICAAIGAKHGFGILLETIDKWERRDPDLLPNFGNESKVDIEPLRELIADTCNAVFSRPVAVETIDLGKSVVFKLKFDPKESEKLIEAMCSPSPDSRTGLSVLDSVFVAIGLAHGGWISFDFEQ